MVTVNRGNVTVVGDSTDITTDILCLMNAYNDLKVKDEFAYNVIVENIKYLIQEDESSLPCIKNFIETLGDLL